ncbi:MAG: hypothetical protein M3310_00010 [Actinomycetota bacterium]|nr:hypothetical protein [Actinomycetota bacterium]
MATEQPVCPVCGNTDWEAADPVVLRPAPRSVRGGGSAVAAFVCTRCEFIRLHRTRGENDSAS